ncbi:hypothetical protein KC19_12G163700 [Ceratodon purpureus]|uniref:UVR domain-containing protein n=1 Tax=Ceratodon purpureus TaxID=3225 RepID=A0A8T0GBY4_CERPU|nr:hypothetical protein KC19_12G163700 [Ceratodon purpureus]
MQTMDHHLSNGDAAAIELRSSMVGDSRGPETSFDIPAAKQLPFNVVYCSGQDEDYPASELNNGVLSRGWQSSRFCYYPQEIVLELQWPSRIINMQLLSHEFKIPTKVEVFVSLIVPYVHEAIGQMKRLGYLALDCNERSGHQARELKSVYIDSPATVVRLVFHNCHCNDYNAYNQVGLMALILTGEPLDEQQWTLLTQPGFEDLLQTPRKQSRNSKLEEAKMQGSSRSSPERKCDVDISTANRILQLQEEKNSAVLGEDYDEAKRLKGLIDRLKIIGEEIKQLENKKQLAVENEDYDTAKSCKKEIEKLRLQEQLSDNNGQAEKGDEVSDCGVNSEESVDELAHAAEGSSQSEDPGRQDSAGTDCCDSERKEFGTQTLHPVKSTVVKKLDKEISCKTPDLRPPPKYRERFYSPLPFISVSLGSTLNHQYPCRNTSRIWTFRFPEGSSQYSGVALRNQILKQYLTVLYLYLGEIV